MKQITANFLRKLIKLDDYIEDRVFTEIRDLATCIDNRAEDIEEVRDLVESELNDRPTFYDMESQVEELVNNEMADVITRLEALEE